MPRHLIRALLCVLLWQASAIRLSADVTHDRPVPGDGGPTKIYCAIGVLDLDGGVGFGLAEAQHRAALEQRGTTGQEGLGGGVVGEGHLNVPGGRP